MAEVINLLGAEAYAATAGTLPAAGFMAVTLPWLMKHDPALLGRVHKVMLPKDYVRLRMTGEVATDPSDAAATALFNVTTREWASNIVNPAGLPADVLPTIRASMAVAGYLRADAASELGLQAGTPIVMGCADQPGASNW